MNTMGKSYVFNPETLFYVPAKPPKSRGRNTTSKEMLKCYLSRFGMAMSFLSASILNVSNSRKYLDAKRSRD